MKMKVSEAVCVGQGPTYEEVSWGPWQFPNINRLNDGRIVCSINPGQDDFSSYGMPNVWFVSEDEGETWAPISPEEAEVQSGTKLPNGDRLFTDMIPPVQIPDDCFPEKPLMSFPGFADIFYIDSLKSGTAEKKWSFRRLPAGSETIVHEKADVDWPYMTVAKSYSDGYMPPFAFGRLRVAPDGSLWQMHYANGADPKDGHGYMYQSVYYFRSTDNGHSWKLASFLSAENIPGAYAFCEQDIAWSKNGTAISLIRGADGCYKALSKDGGFHWDSIERFDDIGVDPAIRILPCGAAIASYGRPGFFLRASYDPDLINWEEPYEIISRADHSVEMNTPCAPGPGHSDGTCSYSEILPLSDNEALVTYVDFYVPDKEGIKRKSLMVRRITFED